ncbi:uncharacterized protein RCH25_004261 [Pelodytes ibericus]
MAKSQRESNDHTVRIQQTYWAKDTAEEDVLQMGAVCSDKVVERVDYYDTDWYELAIDGTWLSKTGREWRLIVDRSERVGPASPDKTSQEGLHNRTLERDGPGGKKTDPTHRKPTSNKSNQKDLKTTQNSNKVLAVGVGRNPSTYYELVDEMEMIAHLSTLLHPVKDFRGATLEDFLSTVGIQQYASCHNTKQVTYKLRGSYTVTFTPDQTTPRKVAVVSLHVDIEKVTQGFQRLEQLANELDLQLQNK